MHPPSLSPKWVGSFRSGAAVVSVLFWVHFFHANALILELFLAQNH